MERKSRPADKPPGVAADGKLVARVKRQIDDEDDRHLDVLLADLLCAAWPSGRAQDQ